MNKLILIILPFILFSCKQIDEKDYPNAKGNILTFNGLAETFSMLELSTDRIYNDIVTTGGIPNHITQDGSRLFLVNSGDNTISIINSYTLTTIKSIHLGVNKNPWMVFPVANTNYIYVTCFESNELLRVDIETEEILSITGIDNKPQGGTLVGSTLYIGNTHFIGWNNFDTGSVTVIDTENNQFKKNITLSYNTYNGINPLSLLAIPERDEVYIFCSGIPGQDDGLIFVIDTTADTIKKVFESGKSPVYSEGSLDIDNNIVYLYGMGCIFSYNYITDTITDFAGDLVTTDKYISGLTYISSTNRILISDFSTGKIYSYNSNNYNFERSYQASDGVQQLLYIK